jgi:hypothetical protein
VGNISVTIDTHEFRFFDMKFVGDFHVMGLFLLLRSHIAVTSKAVVIHPFICEKISGEQLASLGMAIHTGDTGRMDHRR